MACSDKSSKDGVDANAPDGKTGAMPECSPVCADGLCGDDDGCGNTCGCSGGARCQEGVCEPTECGVCADNESCVGGECVCEPNCAGDRPDDGCGGTCPCPGDEVRAANGECTSPEDCVDTCGSAGAACGEICGAKCDVCADGSSCERGACVCQPHCDGSRCDDGCGGLCECGAGTVCNAADDCVAPDACGDTCESADRMCGKLCGESCGGCDDGDSCLAGACILARNCEGCSLGMYLLSREVEGNRIKRVTLAIEYNPVEGEARPRVADFRIGADHDVSLVDAESGMGLSRADKRLYVDGFSGKPWQLLADEHYQLLAYGSGSTENFNPGRLLTLTFEVDTLGPIRFNLQRRLQTFAPSPSDAALQSSDYDQVVVVSQ